MVSARLVLSNVYERSTTCSLPLIAVIFTESSDEFSIVLEMLSRAKLDTLSPNIVSRVSSSQRGRRSSIGALIVENTDRVPLGCVFSVVRRLFECTYIPLA